MDDRPVVVVGVDGSPGSRAALQYALADAARRGAGLRVVAAVQQPEYWSALYGTTAPRPVPDVVAGVESEVRRFVAEVVAETPDEVPVTVEARAGSPAQVLTRAAEDAAVLVLGHRGRGAIRSAVLGSVGLSCVLHASCPVTVVRAADRAANARVTEGAASS